MRTVIWSGWAGWAKPRHQCFYCRGVVFTDLPCRCFRCGCSLTERVTPKMKLRKLSDLCVNNGKRLMITASPIRS